MVRMHDHETLPDLIPKYVINGTAVTQYARYITVPIRFSFNLDIYNMI